MKKLFNLSDDLVRCAICGRVFERITLQHLKFHGTTVPEYKVAFPNAQTRSVRETDRRREKHLKWVEENQEEHQSRCDAQSRALKGRPKPPRTEEHARHISESKQGKAPARTEKMTAAWERQRGRKMPEGFAEAQRQRMLGSTPSAETRRKLSEARMGRCPPRPPDYMAHRPRGPAHYKWKGGVNPEYGGDWPKVAHEIRLRDNFRCLECDKKNPKGYAFPAHHITPVSDLLLVGLYPHRKENLVTLCPRCHARADNNRVWSVDHYRKILMEKYGYSNEFYSEIAAKLALEK